MTNFIQTITVENRQVDKENYFTIGYSPEIEKSLLCVYISWIAGYERYYELDDEDLALFESKREEFLKKYEKEIKAYRTERLIGSGALRDYNFSSLPENILKTWIAILHLTDMSIKTASSVPKSRLKTSIFIFRPFMMRITDKHCLKVMQNNL